MGLSEDFPGHFVYLAENKVKHLYSAGVRLTLNEVKTTITEESKVGAGAKVKASLGNILALFGLSVEGEVSGTLEKGTSSSKEFVEEFTTAQKLMAVLIKLKKAGDLVYLNEVDKIPKKNTPVVFVAELKADTKERSEVEVERIGQVILAGHTDNNYKIEILATLEFMSSKNTWRRFNRSSSLAGFGTLIGSDPEARLARIDPIFLAYS